MQQKSELPEGWAISNLNEISDDIKYGYTASAEKNAVGPHLLRITDIQDGRVDWENVPFCKIKEEQIPKYELKSNDIVFARTGATTGKSYLISSCPRSVFASYLIRLRPNENIDPMFLSLFFSTSDYWEQISQNISGIAQPNCNASKLKELVLPLPPLPEQHRIVLAIESLFTRLNATNEKLDRVPEILKKFRESVLAAACEGKLTEDWRKENPYVEDAKTCINNIIQERKEEYLSTDELTNEEKRKKPKLERCKNASKNIYNLPYSWDICFFEDIAENKKNAIKAGPFGSSLTKGCYVKEGFKVYGQEQVIRNDAFYGDYYISEEKYFELESCKIEPKDILISLVGTIGKVLILPENCKPGIINPRLVKISLNEKISRLYIKIYLESPYVKSLVSSNSHGGTMEILNLKIIKSFPIPLPPLPEQQEIVRRVNALFAFADSIEAKVAAAKEKTEKLRQSILEKAFSGQLVETEAEIARREGRDFETAEILLSKIKAEKGKNETKR